MVRWKGRTLTQYNQNCYDLYNHILQGDIVIKSEGLLGMWLRGRAIYKDNERKGTL